MSLQQESVGMMKASERAEAAPEIEYKMVTQDSLSMFLAAIGGAVLGMLLTLLVLALVNGGTLSFSGQRMDRLEEFVTRINQNVDAVSNNIDTVSQQAATVQQQLGAVETALRSELENQGTNLATINEAVSTLEVTRQQFSLFMQALDGALGDMRAMNPTAENTTPDAVPADAETPAETAPATTTP